MTGAGRSLRSRTRHGLLWQLLGVGSQRVVQLGGFAVLARVLDDRDIGLFGVLLAGIAAIEALTFFAGEQSQIHSRRGHERAYLDTVFTVRIVRGVVICGLLAALAPALAWFFASPELEGRADLTLLFLLLATAGLLDAVQSPARASRIKELDFRRVSLGDLGAALLGTGATIGLALWWRDVWALVVGHLAGTLLRSLISYAVAPYRPRLGLDREVWRELRSYSLGAAGAPFLLVMVFAAPALLLGKLADKAAVAFYSYGEKLAKVPEDLFLRVLGPVALPAYSQLAQETDRLRGAWLRAVRAFMLVGAPMTAVLAWVGAALPALVYGEAYGRGALLFPLLAVHGGLAGLTSVVGPLFWAIGEPQKDRAAQLWRGVTLYLLGIPLTYRYGAEGCALAAVLGIVVALLISLRFAARRLRVAPGEVARAVGAGLGAAGLTLAPLLLLDLVWGPGGLVRCVVGAIAGVPAALVPALRLLRNHPDPAPMPPGPAADAAAPASSIARDI